MIFYKSYKYFYTTFEKFANLVLGYRCQCFVIALQHLHSNFKLEDEGGILYLLLLDPSVEGGTHGVQDLHTLGCGINDICLDLFLEPFTDSLCTCHTPSLDLHQFKCSEYLDKVSTYDSDIFALEGVAVVDTPFLITTGEGKAMRQRSTFSTVQDLRNVEFTKEISN